MQHGKDESRQFSQEENPNTHQHTMPSGCFQPAISSTSPPPARRIVIIDSETESESEGLYPDDDGEAASIIQNQAGLPESQHGIIESSPPPPASGHVNHSVLNNNGEFFLKERCAKTEFLVSWSSLQSSSQCGWRECFWGDEYWHCIVVGQQGEKKFVIIIQILTYKIFSGNDKDWSPHWRLIPFQSNHQCQRWTSASQREEAWAGNWGLRRENRNSCPSKEE